MTDKDAAKILSIMTATYPNYNVKDKAIAVNVWANIFAEYPYEVVQNGLTAYIKSDKSGFAPAPGQIIDYISKASTRNEMSPEEAWGILYKSICKSSYGYKEEYDKLPSLIQKSIGSAEALRDMARDESFNIGVVQSNFFKSYKAYLNRKIEDEKIGVDILDRLEKIGMPQIGVSHDTE